MAASAARNAPIRRTDPTACSIRTPSRRPICICCSSNAVRGPGKSNCGPGWKDFRPPRLCAAVYNRAMPKTLAKAALFALALVIAATAHAQTTSRKRERARSEPAVPAAPVDKRDSVVAAPGPFNGRPYWAALAQCGGIYFRLNVLYTDAAVHARVVKPDPKANAEFTKQLGEAIKIATTYFNGAERFLMTERGIERADAVLTYDGQSRAAGDRVKTIDAGLAAAKSCPALYQACREAFSKQCNQAPVPAS